jgi:hypothetical protein
MPENTKLAVGWIGLGDQALPMAVAIAEAGYPLPVWARRPGSLDGLGGVAHVRHDDIADLAAACDIVGLCVSCLLQRPGISPRQRRGPHPPSAAATVRQHNCLRQEHIT